MFVLSRVPASVLVERYPCCCEALTSKGESSIGASEEPPWFDGVVATGMFWDGAGDWSVALGGGSAGDCAKASEGISSVATRLAAERRTQGRDDIRRFAFIGLR